MLRGDIKLVIFDNISYLKQKELKTILKADGIEIKKVSDINLTDRLDSAVCVFTLTKLFFDTDAFEFLRTQLVFKQLNIIILLERNSQKNLTNGSIAVAWAQALVMPRRRDYKVIAEIAVDDVDYMYKMIDSQINPTPKPILEEYEIYTDGACSGNPGCGGWAAVIINKRKGKITEMSGGEFSTTNNRMEIMAAIRALETLKERCIVNLYSDSAYLVNAFEMGWMKQWKANRWKNSDKVLVKNIDLWQKLDGLTQLHEISFKKVKGHANDEYNNRCDELAVAESKKRKVIDENN